VAPTLACCAEPVVAGFADSTCTKPRLRGEVRWLRTGEVTGCSSDGKQDAAAGRELSACSKPGQRGRTLQVGLPISHLPSPPPGCEAVLSAVWPRSVKVVRTSGCVVRGPAGCCLDVLGCGKRAAREQMGVSSPEKNISQPDDRVHTGFIPGRLTGCGMMVSSGYTRMEGSAWTMRAEWVALG
jgi:hypothetical protein